jgi:hypothetical protein
MPAQVRIQVRRDSTANWAAAQTAAGSTPILAVGEIGFDTTENQIKIGDGVTLWGALDYASGDFEISETAPTPASNGDLWFKPTGAEAYIYNTTWVRLNPKLANDEVTTIKINNGAVTTEKIATGASIDKISNKRVVVSTTTPATPAGGWSVGDVWISY